MTYGQVKNQTLKLLNQYSVAGTVVAESYNNQADYINRIPNLINEAMMEIATTTKKIPANLCLDDLPSEDLGKQIRYKLPEDFYQFKSGSIVKTDDGRVLHTNQYMLDDRCFITIPKKELETGKFSITYYRYPRLLKDKPSDNDALDNTPETHLALPYHAAAMLVDADEAYLCALFNNKFEDLLTRMSPGISSETHAIDDAYAFGGWCAL